MNLKNLLNKIDQDQALNYLLEKIKDLEKKAEEWEQPVNRCEFSLLQDDVNALEDRIENNRRALKNLRDDLDCGERRLDNLKNRLDSSNLKEYI